MGIDTYINIFYGYYITEISDEDLDQLKHDNKELEFSNNFPNSYNKQFYNSFDDIFILVGELERYDCREGVFDSYGNLPHKQGQIELQKLKRKYPSIQVKPLRLHILTEAY